MKFKSLKTKLLFWFGATLFIVLNLFHVTIYYYLEESLEKRVTEEFKLKAELLRKDLQVHDLSVQENYLSGIEVAVLENKKIIDKTKTFYLKDLTHYLHKEKKIFIFENDNETLDVIYIYNFNDPFIGTIVLYKKGILSRAEEIERILSFLIPVLLLVLLFIGSKLIDKILIPIKDITDSANQIAIDNFSYTIKLPKENDEIKDLTNSFNQMIHRLQEGIKNIDRFNSDVSHELYTPLTVIQGELEVALKKDRDLNYYKTSLEKALMQTDQLKSLIDSLLLLTRYTKENIEQSFEECFLDSIILDVLSSYENELEKKRIDLQIKKLENIQYKGNPTLLRSLFANLIDNAIKYTPENRSISLSLTQNEKITFIIQDEGIGIEKNKIQKLTERFYRADISRNKTIQGFGLGLSLVSNAVTLHQGELQITSNTDKGITVTVHL